MTEKINENIEQQMDNQPEGPAEKLFTQEEVNAIVQKRLNKVKTNAASTISDEDLAARTKALDEREAALTARETRETCRNYLRENGLSDDLLDIFGTANAEEFIQKVEITRKAMGVTVYPKIPDGGEVIELSQADDLRSVFLNTPEHTPKEVNPYW